ncbi:MAG: lamin tail domain-containing protein [bacterium]|nr:lamin tail domain-containing protein [bacterium]MDZ4296117.1 lamin tail domain-containing protein [Patescibacteria group bacterium]
MFLGLVTLTFAFSEIMYDRPGNDTNHEWVELVNCSSETILVTDAFRFFDGSPHLVNEPTVGTRAIEPGAVFILAADAKTAAATFFSDYPGFAGTVFDTVMSLANTSDTLELRGDGGGVLAAVTYESSWGGAGTGKTLEKEHPCHGNPSGGWRESAADSGTPGMLAAQSTPTPTPTPAAPTPTPLPSSSATSAPTPLLSPAASATPTPSPAVTAAAQSTPQPSPSPSASGAQLWASLPVTITAASPAAVPPLLNEFLPSPQGPDAEAEYIELYNPTALPIDLSNWYLDDGDGGSAPYVLAQGTVIAPGTYLVFAAATTRIALNNDGDAVRLLDPAKTVREAVTYGRAGERLSYAKDETGKWQWTTVPTPGSKNALSPEAAAKRTAPGDMAPASKHSTSTEKKETGDRLMTDASGAAVLDLTAIPAAGDGALFANLSASANTRSATLALSIAVASGLLIVFGRRFFS